MPELQLTDYGLDRPESGDDVVVPFTLEQLDCRGRVVRLSEALEEHDDVQNVYSNFDVDETEMEALA